jgi:hypothetical protein
MISSTSGQSLNQRNNCDSQYHRGYRPAHCKSAMIDGLVKKITHGCAHRTGENEGSPEQHRPADRSSEIQQGDNC